MPRLLIKGGGDTSETMFKVALDGVTRKQTRFAYWVNLVYQCHSNNLYGETYS